MNKGNEMIHHAELDAFNRGAKAMRQACIDALQSCLAEVKTQEVQARTPTEADLWKSAELMLLTASAETRKLPLPEFTQPG